jgi:alpha-glucuronidase
MLSSAGTASALPKVRALATIRSFGVWAASACAALVFGCSESGSPSPGAAGSNATAGTGGTTSMNGGAAGSGAGAAGTVSSSGTGGAGGAGSVAGSAGSAGENSGGMVGSTETYPLPAPGSLPDEDGSSLWLRYPKLPIPGRLAEYQASFKQVVSAVDSPTMDAAEAELVQGLGGLTGGSVPLSAEPSGDGAVVLGTASSALIKDLPLAARLSALGPEGYLVESAQVAGKQAIVVAGNTELGVLYGSFALLRHAQRHSALAALSLSGSPKIKNRLLDHWDNLDGSVERGYAGKSIWSWSTLPGSATSARLKTYARANASIGINGTVLTNVNADAQVLTSQYLSKVKALADAFRPYGIKVYLTARFSAPIELGGLSTADPLDAGVKKWWADKANEIYQQIPDFGGFLVKANSEGQPGPQDYNRNHADGANMLAAALGTRGIVMWRAFVYSNTSPPDRIKQAYEEFKPLDGKFNAGVLVQVKNGPLDFQPREPFSPLFGAMPKTPLALELQVTKEYLGEDTHLAYLGPLYEEVLKADTQAAGAGSTVARIIDGTTHGYSVTAIAGVANIGNDTNWTGSHMNQANWYVFGRMAWDPDISAKSVADEWVRQTFSNDPLLVDPVVQLMMSSREALVSYMTPLGLAHIMASDHHYGPGPWVSDQTRAEWNPVYYHKADAQGIGFDRTAQGSNAVAQYAAGVGQAFGSRTTVPDDLLLFFHHVGWQDKLVSSGRSVWEELVYRYSHGVDEVGTMRETWATVKDRLDAKRFQDVAGYLQTQHYEARWWRDACLSYFSDVSKQAIPSGYAPPAKTLAEYKNLKSQCPTDATKPRCTPVYMGNPSPAILK